MKRIDVADFPKPIEYSQEVTVGPASRQFTIVLLTFSSLLAGLAIYLGATSQWSLNWWQWGGFPWRSNFDELMHGSCDLVAVCRWNQHSMHPFRTSAPEMDRFRCA